MPSPGEKVSPKVTDEEGIDKPIILDWLIISVFQNKKTKPPFIKSDFVFSLRATAVALGVISEKMILQNPLI